MIYVSRTGWRVYAPASDFRRCNDLPYGKWTCADGREVLFNRWYEPLWQRHPGSPPEPADPMEWVRWIRQEWFYDDGTRDKQKIGRGEAALAEWGLDPPPKRLRASSLIS
jgi:hypothetical protein